MYGFIQAFIFAIMKIVYRLLLVLLLSSCNKFVLNNINDEDIEQGNQKEVLFAVNDTVKFYLCGPEISNIILSSCPTPSSLIKTSRYRMPTKLEVSSIFRNMPIPEQYWKSHQRILCFDAPQDAEIKIGSTKFGTGFYYTYVPYGNVTKAGFKTKYCIIPIRSELLNNQGEKVEIDINDKWK